MELRNDHQNPTDCVAQRNREWLTRKELGARWSIPPATLAQWGHLGRGPRYATFGKHVRYRLTDVLAYEEQAFGAGGDQGRATSPRP